MTTLNHKKNLTLAIQLALTAPTDELALDCIEMAYYFAQKLKPSEIEECKQAFKC